MKADLYELKPSRVYYWQARRGQNILKGSLFTPALGGSYIKVNWEPVEGASEYRIREYDKTGKRIQTISVKGNSVITKGDFSSVKFIVPLKGEKDLLDSPAIAKADPVSIGDAPPKVSPVKKVIPKKTS